MSTIVTRAGKGSALTHNEVDANFINLNTDKIEAAQSVTLTNKTIALGSNTVSGTTAQFNTALTDGDFATLAGSGTLTNKTISGSNNTLSNIGNSSLTNNSVTIGSTSVSLGSTATTVSGLTLSSPTVSGGTINNASVGATTPSTGAFTTLSASSTVSGTGFSTYLASPPAIGGTAPAAGSFTTLSATGVTTVQAGTVSAPAITTSGDTNTGIFFPAADTIAFTEGGTEVMRIDSAANVGVGTTSPGAKLHVYGNIRSAVTGNILELGTDTGLGFIYNRSAGALTFGTNNSERMRIDSSGNVGVGISSPGAKLNIDGASGDGVALFTNNGTASAGGNGLRVGIDNSLNAYVNNTKAGTLLLYTSNGERVRIDSSGNVGVNNTNPNQFVTNGRVFNISGTANNSGSANLMMPGSSGTPGAGYASTEVFAISSVTAAQEITRVTGTGTNGFRAYIKVIVTGHTGSIGNGINIKEWFWDGGTGGVTQISTYTNGSVPTLSVTNTTNNVLIINLASSNGSNQFNGVMKVEWMLPIDFSSNTFTIS